MRGRAQREVLGPSQVRRELRDLLRDERNLSAFCHDCHMNAEHGNRRLSWGDVPVSAHEFARELGPEWFWRLRRAYR